MMKSKSLIGAAVMLLLLLGTNARAQVDPGSIEVGAHFSHVRLNNLQTLSSINIIRPRVLDKSYSGFGGRMTFNLANWLAIDGELNYFPDDNDDGEGGNLYQGLLGVKAGIRGERVGFFGKARPGFSRLSSLPDCPEARREDCGFQPKMEFALDVGAVLELYPSRRSIVRFDFGDTLIFQRDRLFLTAVPGPGGFLDEVRTFFQGKTTNNFQFSVGVGFRF